MITRYCLITFLATILVITGAVMIADSGYFYAKGLFVQYLLNRAWERSKKTKRSVPVWGWQKIRPVGRLIIRSIQFSGIVMKGADTESLAFGPAHISLSSRPGSGGNIAIAGHRDTYFRNLGHVKRGEVIELESMSSVQYFVVTDIQVTDPENTRWIEDQGEDAITLITCYPFDYIGPAPQRYVVRGTLMKKSGKGGKSETNVKRYTTLSEKEAVSIRK